MKSHIYNALSVNIHQVDEQLISCDCGVRILKKNTSLNDIVGY